MARIDSLASKLAVGKSAAKSDQFARERVRKAVTNLADIKDRPHGDLRPVRSSAVIDLFRSIHDVGLIEPIVVDRSGFLLAGLHRRTAIELLALPPEERPARLTERSGVALTEEQLLALASLPQRKDLSVVQIGIREDVDAAGDPALAQKIEATENVVRTNFTNGEIERLAAKLVGEGKCRPLQMRGRPSRDDGRMAVTRAVSVALGISERHVQRVLRTAENDLAPLAKPDPSTLTALDPIGAAKKRLQSALAAYIAALQNTRSSKVEKKAAEELARLLAGEE